MPPVFRRAPPPPHPKGKKKSPFLFPKVAAPPCGGLRGRWSLPQAACAEELPLNRIKLPPGFEISVYAQVPSARSLALGEKGTVFVGNRRDAVYAIVPRESGKPEVLTIGAGLESPNGVAFRGGSLYVAEISRILRYDNIEANLRDPPKPVVVSDRFPHDGHHGWKYIAFGPDGWLYVPVGRTVQYLRAGPRPLRADLTHQARRQRLRSIRAGHPQYGRLRLGPAHG